MRNSIPSSPENPVIMEFGSLVSLVVFSVTTLTTLEKISLARGKTTKLTTLTKLKNWKRLLPVGTRKATTSMNGWGESSLPRSGCAWRTKAMPIL